MVRSKKKKKIYQKKKAQLIEGKVGEEDVEQSEHIPSGSNHLYERPSPNLIN